MLRLYYQGKTRHIFANTFDTDLAATQKIVADKVATAAVLQYAAIPHVEHELFYGFQRSTLAGASVWQPIIAYAQQHNWQVVAKALSSSGGKDVHICLQRPALEQACQQLLALEPALTLSPYYPAKYEYRLMMFQGTCHILYRKNKPHIVGDGRHSIAQLLNHKARTQAGGQRARILRALMPVNGDDIPAQGEIVLLSHKHNLSKGAEVSMIAEGKTKTDLIALAQRTMESLGLHFGSVDILATQQGLRVLEVNSGVMVDNLLKLHPEFAEQVEQMYRTVVLALFREHPVSSTHTSAPELAPVS